MSASRTFAIVCSSAVLALGVALLSAQQQPHAVIDPVRTLEARYELATPWWDPDRRTSLAASKDFDDPSGKLRLLNQSGEVQTNCHPFFTPLGSNDHPCRDNSGREWERGVYLEFDHRSSRRARADAGEDRG